MASSSYVGRPHLRRDTFLKVQGGVKYVSDMVFQGALYLRLLGSPYPHARVKRVDYERALRVKGVVDVLTPFNVPQRLFGRTFSPVPWKVPQDRRILDQTLRFVGDPVVAVVAESPETAEDAVERVEVEYQELEAVLSADKALEADAPLVHEEVVLGDRLVALKDNVGYHDVLEVGNKEAAYSRVSKMYEEEFRTQILYNAPIEPHATWVVPSMEGTLDVWTTTQSIHGTRYWLSRALGLGVGDIRVHSSQLGGGFGAKYNMAIHEPIVAIAAMRAKRPVKYVASRSEDFLTSGRRPCRMKVKIGVGPNGEIEVMEMHAVLQSGGYADHMVEAVTCMGGWFLSDYRSTYKFYEGFGVYTNLPVYSAMRGFLNPQQNFAVESMIDEIAEDFGMDPLEFRLKNAPRIGDVYYAQGPTVTTEILSIELEQCTRAAGRLIGWGKNKSWVENGLLVGLGMAVGHHTSGTGGRMRTEQDRLEGTGAIVKINEDGSVVLTTALVEMGPGEHDVLATICAETLGVEPRSVRVNAGDTDTAPFDMGTHASRGTFVGGLGVVRAALEAKQQLIDVASKVLDAKPEQIDIKEGRIFVRGDPERGMSVGEAAHISKTRFGRLIITESGLRPDAAPPSWCAVFVKVAVDPETGEVFVRDVVEGFDIGVVVNPPEAEAQAMGGFMTGLGYALLEEVVIGENGWYLNPDFAGYTLPGTMDLPRIQVLFAKSYEPRGPFGAKSIGELSTNPVASAIANAVSNITGHRFRSLPIHREDVLRVLSRKGVGERGA